jgi:hypothetical protein
MLTSASPWMPGLRPDMSIEVEALFTSARWDYNRRGPGGRDEAGHGQAARRGFEVTCGGARLACPHCGLPEHNLFTTACAAVAAPGLLQFRGLAACRRAPRGVRAARQDPGPRPWARQTPGFTALCSGRSR